jgi:hypothetical protein
MKHLASEIPTDEARPRPSFESEVQRVAQRLRGTLTRALTSIRAPLDKPLGLSRELSLDKSIAWKLSRLLSEDDAVVALQRLPGRSGQRILLDAMRRSAVDEALVKEADAALEAFENFVEVHAGDRETFELMLTNLNPAAAEEREESTRKLAFQGNSAIWGVQARVQLSIHILAPHPDGEALNIAIISGLLDFRRLRADTPWSVATVRSFHDSGEPIQATVSGPIDPMSGYPERAPLLTRFCSNPDMPMGVHPNADGTTRYEILPGPLGITGSCSCVTGWCHRKVWSRYRTERDRVGEHFVSLSTPVEVLYHEFYVHRDFVPGHTPSLLFYSQLPGGPRYPHEGRDIGRLPVAARMLPLGSPPMIETVDVPRHRELVEAGVRCFPHPIDEYLGFRVRLRYPPIPTIAVYRYPLPERP